MVRAQSHLPNPRPHDLAVQTRLARAALLDLEGEIVAIEDYADTLPASADRDAFYDDARELRKHLQFARYRLDQMTERLGRHEEGVIR